MDVASRVIGLLTLMRQISQKEFTDAEWDEIATAVKALLSDHLSYEVTTHVASQESADDTRRVVTEVTEQLTAKVTELIAAFSIVFIQFARECERKSEDIDAEAVLSTVGLKIARTKLN